VLQIVVTLLAYLSDVTAVAGIGSPHPNAGERPGSEGDCPHIESEPLKGVERLLRRVFKACGGAPAPPVLPEIQLST